MTNLKYLKLNLLIFILILFMSKVSLCQCTSTNLNPLSNLEASSFNDTVIISSTSNAGEYFIIEKLSVGDTYIFSSSNVGDYLTIRDKDGLTLLAYGFAPLSYTISGPDIVSVHINLVAPPCGADLIDRTTTAVCSTCSPIPPKVKIGSTLEVSGVITVGDVDVSPVAGMIRWNESINDFEGYDGENWRSLTRKKAWGTALITDRNENQKVVAPDGQSFANFGYSVFISGDYAIVGAPFDWIEGNNAQGSAYIFIRNGSIWTQQSKLTASDGSVNEYFGYSVSISGDYAIVGAYGDEIGGNTSQGSSYIYLRNGTTWIQQAKLTASDGSADDYFGFSVSISGDYVIVGAHMDDVGGNTTQGSSYIFVRNGSTWNQQGKLTATDGSADDYFGFSVSISGDYAIVGAHQDDIGGNVNQGSAYMYIRNGSIWTEQAKLTTTDGSANDYFGYSVSMSGDDVIIGAHQDDVGGNANQGSVYIYKRSGTLWLDKPKLTASDGSANDYFGYSVSISGDYIIVGAHLDDPQESAYIFMINDNKWTQQTKLTASEGSAGDQFGYSVSISGGYSIVGAYNDSIGSGIFQGSAYFINR